jgi:hypothetical protein
MLNSFELYQNYPNPFNPVTNISYNLPLASNVELNVFSITGQKVASLVNSYQKAGYYSKKWNASNLASGTYFYELKVNSLVKSKKMLYLK